jgi:hypothetical protein
MEGGTYLLLLNHCAVPAAFKVHFSLLPLSLLLPMLLDARYTRSPQFVFANVRTHFGTSTLHAFLLYDNWDVPEARGELVETLTSHSDSVYLYRFKSG